MISHAVDVGAAFCAMVGIVFIFASKGAEESAESQKNKHDSAKERAQQSKASENTKDAEEQEKIASAAFEEYNKQKKKSFALFAAGFVSFALAVVLVFFGLTIKYDNSLIKKDFLDRLHDKTIRLEARIGELERGARSRRRSEDYVDEVI